MHNIWVMLSLSSLRICLLPHDSFIVFCSFSHAVPPVGKVTGSTHVSDHNIVTLASCAWNARPAAEVLWRLGAHSDSLRTESSRTQLSDGTVTVVTHILGAPSKHLNQKKVQCVVKHSSLTTPLELDYVINVHCK